MHSDKLLSDTIRFLRFPLMVGVVIVHTTLDSVIIGGDSVTQGGMFPIFDIFNHLFDGEIVRMRVPLFFFFSGFLFFFQGAFSKQLYADKLKRRVKTLLVPYLFWISALLLMIFVAQQVFPSFTSGNNLPIKEYTLIDWLKAYWHSFPMSPFWFIRDLMVVVVCSPLLYFLVRYLKIFGVLLLGVLWCMGIQTPWVGVNVTAFFFFGLGAWYALTNKNYTPILVNYRWYLLGLYLPLLVLNTVLWSSSFAQIALLQRLGILLGMATLVAWVARGIQTQTIHANKTLSDAAFFLFCIHNPITVFASKLWVTYLSPMTDAKMIIGYVLIPTVVSIGAVYLYLFLQRKFPHFTAIITGGR